MCAARLLPSKTGPFASWAPPRAWTFALRYRLLGFDTEWQEASRRRQAIYTNLPPGRFSFEVIGANEDGLWNKEGARLEIQLPPTFVQSTQFKVLIGLAVAALLYAAYALRVRYLSERLRLNQTLNFAEQLLVEGRDQILDLRASSKPELLEMTLAQFGKGLAEHRPHVFELKINGSPRQLRPEVHEELYAIAREALFNASRYAAASRIELELEYGASAFAMRIRDNGCGLEEPVLAAGGRPGHWGPGRHA